MVQAPIEHIQSGPQSLMVSKAFALHALARQLSSAPDSFRPFPGLPLGRLLIAAPQLHLTEHALALHFFLQRLEGLIDIVVSDYNLNDGQGLLLIDCVRA